MSGRPRSGFEHPTGERAQAIAVRALPAARHGFPVTGTVRFNPRNDYAGHELYENTSPDPSGEPDARVS